MSKRPILYWKRIREEPLICERQKGGASNIFTTLVWCGTDSNSRPHVPKEGTLPTELLGRSKDSYQKSSKNMYILKNLAYKDCGKRHSLINAILQKQQKGIGI